MPIALVAMVYTCPQSGETTVFEGHQHLYFGDKLDHSLWNPNQLQNFGVKVYDCLKQFDLDLMFCIALHCIALEGKSGTPVEIPLHLNSIIQYIETRYLTDEEMLENFQCVVITKQQAMGPFLFKGL